VAFISETRFPLILTNKRETEMGSFLGHPNKEVERMTARKRQVIALGGGGFAMEPDNPALDLYVLRQAQTSRPAVSLLGTASGDADSFLVKFYKAFSRYDCRSSHLPFFQRTPNLREPPNDRGSQ
jgi:hypothetical protein